ncbi:glycosyltransferase [Robinsoniella peoriensis]|uniref:glycosyltransferase n=1 Tax=Robinsoniella peoriensis TaxID=180332 RepID=UPI0005C7C854|nr:glycosyltransferase [Robinsoniella peoriensis]
MEHVSFVILHYVVYDYTIKCINSILNNIEYDKYTIIVIDNGSPDDSFKEVEQLYANNKTVICIKSEKNLGFAKGNNLGYKYAKNNLRSSFIIIANNDTIFEQPDFVNILKKEYAQEQYGLLGPDIVRIDGYHQSPYRPEIISKDQVKRWVLNRNIWYVCLKVNKFFSKGNNSPVLQKIYNKRDKKNRAVINHSQRQKHVVLQGACVIYSPLFIKRFDYGFYPETFMYCEEDIIAYLCEKNGLVTMYTPSLKIIHAESASTSANTACKIDKELFVTKNILKSLKILSKLMD